ncbi:hypothetical protein RYX36_000151 [Vicia faba]
MLVQDPSKGNDVDAIFNQARQLGAVERPLDQLQEPPRSTSFAGTGRLLSGETVQNASNSQQPESVIHNIVFWSSGFTVNNGPLRRLDDLANASFLESIKKSECPKELEPADRRSAVNVNLIRRNENYREPERAQVSFQGVGRTLGSSSNSVAPEPNVASTAPLISAPLPFTDPISASSAPFTSVYNNLHLNLSKCTTTIPTTPPTTITVLSLQVTIFLSLFLIHVFLTMLCVFLA